MAEMSRAEYLDWAKRRALDYLKPGPFRSPMKAMTSMMSDLSKHSELKSHVGLRIAPMFYGAHNDESQVMRWIEGFN